MELKKFVTSTLNEITEAINDSTNEKMRFVLDCRTSKGIHFDLAITSTGKGSLSGEGKISIEVLAKLGAEAGLEYAQTAANRVQFNVLGFPENE